MVNNDHLKTPPVVASERHVRQQDALGVLPLGTHIGKYEIVEMLGQGAFGITYRARDTQLRRDVAVKEYLPASFALRHHDRQVLPRSTQTADDFLWGRERFLDEARTLATLEEAPGIVNVYDFMEANGTAYMVMALVRGETVEARLKRERRLQQPAVEQLLYPLLDGLERVHAAGFLHRDIKPANILLDAGGRPTLIDFGASRAALQGRTQAMTAVYTPGYAAFEQFTSAKQGPWTDIYALSATLYHCITGASPLSASDRMIEDRLVPAAEAGAGRYAPSFLAAVDAGLKLKAGDRPQTIAEWRHLVLGTAAKAIGHSASATTRKADAQTQRIEGASSARGTTSRRPARLAWMAATFVVLATAGGGGWVFLRDARETAHRAEEESRREAARKVVEAKEAAEATRRRQTEEAERQRADAARRAEQDAARKAAEEKVAAEAAERRRIEDAERQRAAADAARKSEQEAARKAAEEKAAAEAAQRRAEEQARVELEARRRAGEDTRRAAEEKARADRAAREKAEAEERARVEAETKRKAETEAHAAAEERARADAEAKRQAEAAEAALRLSEADRKRVQVALTSLGHDTRGNDGAFGPRTRQTIAAWQKSQGALETGYLTALQFAALRQQAAAALTRYDEELKKIEEEKRAEEERRRQPPAPATAPPPPGAPNVATAPSAVDRPGDTQGWIDVRPIGGGYRVRMPAAPKLSSQTVPLADGRTVQMFEATAETAAAAYLGTHVDYPADLVRSMSSDTLLDNVRNGSAKGHTLRSEERITISGIPGREYVIVRSNGVIIVTRSFLVGNRLYQMIVAGRPGVERAPETHRFLRSFALTR